ncbi:MAG: hypothetical protein AB9903_30110 [Vulcanimicrobiota bacterium]
MELGTLSLIQQPIEMNSRKTNENRKTDKRESVPAESISFDGSVRNADDADKLRNLARSNTKSMTSEIASLYNDNKTGVHIAWGALMAAGIALFAGFSGAPVISAAGSGVFAGWIAGKDTKKAMYMAGGAIIGTAIATMAGCPPAGIVGLAGTGTFAGWAVDGIYNHSQKSSK